MFGTIIDYLFHSEEYKDTGSEGERHTYRILVKHFNKKHVLRNVYLKKADNEYTEIDLIAVSKCGIFVFESKNYSGWIFGNENDSKWTQILNGKHKILFYNPIWQNNTHIKSLVHNLPQFNSVAYYSYIVFSDICRIKNISVSSNNTYVMNRYTLGTSLHEVLCNSPSILSVNDIDNIINILSPFCRPDEQIKEKHLNDLEHKFSICPICNGTLVKRINKNTGNTFYGCLNYPKCKYTTDKLMQV